MLVTTCKDEENESQETDGTQSHFRIYPEGVINIHKLINDVADAQREKNYT